MLDNEAAKFAFIRGSSDNEIVDVLVKKFATLEADEQVTIWFCRVASYSDIADPPSRGEVAHFFNERYFNCSDDAKRILNDLLKELWGG